MIFVCKGICEKKGKKSIYTRLRHEYSRCNVCSVYYHFRVDGGRCECCGNKLALFWKKDKKLLMRRKRKRKGKEKQKQEEEMIREI